MSEISPAAVIVGSDGVRIVEPATTPPGPNDNALPVLDVPARAMKDAAEMQAAQTIAARAEGRIDRRGISGNRQPFIDRRNRNDRGLTR